MQCTYYKNLNGVQGECTVEPPKPVKDRWSYPVVEKDCHCRFHTLEFPVHEITASTKKQTARQKLLAQKKAEQENLKNSAK